MDARSPLGQKRPNMRNPMTTASTSRQLPPVVVDNFDRLADLCRDYNVNKLDIFGSATTDHFTDSSDLDFIAFFNDTAPRTAYHFAGLKVRLEELFNRKIDLLDGNYPIKNPYLKIGVEKTRRPLYEA